MQYISEINGKTPRVGQVIDDHVVVNWENNTNNQEVSGYTAICMNKEEIDREIDRLFELRYKLTALPHPKEKEAYNMGRDDELYGNNHAPGWG